MLLSCLPIFSKIILIKRKVRYLSLTVLEKHERNFFSVLVAANKVSCKPIIYVSLSTSELKVRLVPLNRFKPSSKIFY